MKKIILPAVITLLLYSQTCLPQIAINLYNHYNYNIEESRALARTGFNSVFTNWSLSGTVNTVSFSRQWFLSKLRADGTVLTFRTYGMPFDDSCYYMTRMPSVTGEHVMVGQFGDPLLVPHAGIIITDSNFNRLSAFILNPDSLGSCYRHVAWLTPFNFINAGFEKIRIGTATPYKIIASEFNTQTGVVWSSIYYINNYSDIFSDRAYSVTYQPIDNSFAVTGTTNRLKTGTVGLTDVFVMKLGPGGVPVWYKVYALPPVFHAEAYKIISLPDSCYAVAGFTNAPDTSRHGDAWIFKIDLAGNVRWSRLYGNAAAKEVAHTLDYNNFANTISFGGWFNSGGSDEILGGVIRNFDGGLVTAPSFRTNATGSDRIYDVKFDKSPVSANQLVSTGFYSGMSVGAIDFIYLRTNLNFTFQNCLSPYFADTPVFVPVVADFPVIREYNQHVILTLPDSVFMLNQVNECLIVGTGTDKGVTREFGLYQNTPNPFNSVTRIQFSVSESAYTELSIYDITGRKVAEPVREILKPGTYILEWNAGRLSSGVYYYCLKSGNNTAVKKLVLIK